MTAVTDELIQSFAGDTQDEQDATAAIRAACGWHIAGQVVTTEALDTDGGRVIALRTLHLTSVDAVTDTVTGDPIAGWDPIRGWSRSGLLTCPSGWPLGFRAVTVTYRHGFVEVPADLAAAARSIARHMDVDPAKAPVTGYTKTQGAKSISKTFSVATVSALVGTLSMVERLVLERYSLGPLP